MHLLMSVAQLLLRRSGARRELLVQAGAALRQPLLGLGAASLQLSVERVGPVLCEALDDDDQLRIHPRTHSHIPSSTRHMNLCQATSELDHNCAC